jgi:glc operon protein GlcG
MAPSNHPPGPPGAPSLAAAQAGVAAAVNEATERGVGVVVAVASASGDPLALARMDGVPPLAAESALRKCRTVSLTWQSTEGFAASLRGDLETEPEYFHGMHHVGPMMTIGGGIPVVVDGAMIAIVAVSGASTADDIAIAEVAVTAVAATHGTSHPDR